MFAGKPPEDKHRPQATPPTSFLSPVTANYTGKVFLRVMAACGQKGRKLRNGKA